MHSTICDKSLLLYCDGSLRMEIRWSTLPSFLGSHVGDERHQEAKRCLCSGEALHFNSNHRTRVAPIVRFCQNLTEQCETMDGQKLEVARSWRRLLTSHCLPRTAASVKPPSLSSDVTWGLPDQSISVKGHSNPTTAGLSLIHYSVRN